MTYTQYITTILTIILYILLIHTHTLGTEAANNNNNVIITYTLHENKKTYINC